MVRPNRTIPTVQSRLTASGKAAVEHGRGLIEVGGISIDSDVAAVFTDNFLQGHDGIRSSPTRRDFVDGLPNQEIGIGLSRRAKAAITNAVLAFRARLARPAGGSDASTIAVANGVARR